MNMHNVYAKVIGMPSLSNAFIPKSLVMLEGVFDGVV